MLWFILYLFWVQAQHYVVNSFRSTETLLLPMVLWPRSEKKGHTPKCYNNLLSMHRLFHKMLIIPHRNYAVIEWRLSNNILCHYRLCHKGDSIIITDDSGAGLPH